MVNCALPNNEIHEFTGAYQSSHKGDEHIHFSHSHEGIGSSKAIDFTYTCGYEATPCDLSAKTFPVSWGWDNGGRLSRAGATFQKAT